MKEIRVLYPNSNSICIDDLFHQNPTYIKLLITLLLIYGSVAVSFAQVLPDTVYLEEVIVETGHYVPYKKEITDESEIDKRAVRDIGDYLRSIPNVSGIRRGGPAVDPVIRGFRYSQLNVFMDNGVRLEGGCPNRMDPVAAHVEIEDIREIEVIKGPFLLRYGPSLGGIINMKTIQPGPYEKWEIHAKGLYGYESNWDGQRKFISLNGGNQHVFFNASAGHKRYGDYKDGNESTINSSFEKYNYSAKIGFIPVKNHTFIFSYSQVYGRDIMFPSLPMDETKDDTRILSFDYNVSRPGKLLNSLDFKAYYSNVDHTMDNSKRPNYSSRQAVSVVDATVNGGRLEIGLEKGKMHLFFGGDYQRTDKDGTRSMTMIMTMPDMPPTRTTTLSNLWNNAIIENAGLFSEIQTHLGTYELTFAVRGDYNIANSEDSLQLQKDGHEYFGDASTNYLNFSASAGISKIINRHLTTSISVGKGTRSPDMLERYIKFLPVGYDNYDYLGDPQLKPESNYQADLTIRYNNERFGKASLNFFYAYADQFITAQLLPSSIAKPKTMGALGVKQYINANYALLHGFELAYNTNFLSKRMTLDVIASYTGGIIDATTKYLITNEQVTGSEAVKNDPLPEIPPFEATVGISGQLLDGAVVPKAELRLVAAQKHVSEAYYEPETPGFAIANFSVHNRLNRFISISLGVNNLLNKKYYEHLNRRILGSTEKLYEPGRVIYANVLFRI